MYQQQQQSQQPQSQQQAASLLQEKDWLNTVLCELKRTAREYTTAVTESNDQSLRQVFTNLLNSTLTLQGQLFQLMKQQNMYSASSPALSQEIQKQVQQLQQSGKQAFQFAQQKISQKQQQNLFNTNLAAEAQYAGFQNNRTSSQQQSYM